MKTEFNYAIASIALTLLLGLTACGGKKPSSENEVNQNDSTTVVADTLETTKLAAAEEKKYEAGIGELGLFDLRGPVKKCIMRDAFGKKHTYTFDEKGFWKTEDGQNLKKIFFAGITRDKAGRITEGNTDDFYSMFYEWDTKGLVKESWGGGSSVKNSYDAEGYLTKQVVTIEPDMGSDEAPEIITRTFIPLEKDQYGNWTKRKDQKGKVEERAIEYYVEN